MAGPEALPEVVPDQLGRALEVVAAPVRLALLHRLARPAFVPDLAREFGMTRQAIKKHLEALREVDLVVATPSRRGALPATSWCANPAGLFAFKEGVAALAVSTDSAVVPPMATRHADGARVPANGGGWGLLLVHGDTAGRWFPLAARANTVLGRDPKADVPLVYDGFASTRHALLRRGPDGWTLTDLQSTNGTRVNFRPVPPGEPVPVRAGDLVTIGKTHLLLRDGS